MIKRDFYFRARRLLRSPFDGFDDFIIERASRGCQRRQVFKKVMSIIATARAYIFIDYLR